MVSVFGGGPCVDVFMVFVYYVCSMQDNKGGGFSLKITFNLAHLLRAYLQEHPDMSQYDFSKLADVNPNTVSRYLNDDLQQPNLETVSRLCEVIGIRDMNQVFLVIEEDE